MSEFFITFAVATENDMGKNIYIALLCVSAAAFAACGGSEQNKDIVIRKVKTAGKKSVQKVGDYSQSRVVDWHGVPFTVAMERTADKSLPIVRDETGCRYYDNRIVVRITSKDGQDVFSHVFTKDAFAGCVDAAYLHDNALLGIVFDRVEGNDLCFAASIGSPDKMSDDYVPILVKVAYGTYNISMCKDTMRDLDERNGADDELQQAEEDGV